jgi:Domain of unknown function (DUF4352)
VTVALTAGCSSGSGASGEGSSSPAREINESLTLTQDDGSALVTLISVTESYKGDGTKADSGNFVATKLKFEGKTGQYVANPLYVKLKKANGDILELDDFAVPSAESIGASSGLPAGVVTQGTLAFDTAYDPGASMVVTDTLGRILGMWPLAGGKPVMGDGSQPRAINKSLTDKQYDSSALVTLVSVRESKGGTEKITAPESGNLVIVEVKFEGKTGEYSVSSSYVQLQKPDGKIIDESEGNGTYGLTTPEELASTDLAPGKTATGKVAFDTPLAPGTKIVITDGLDKVTSEFPL